MAKAWKQQKQFVADASHELKTPLTVIMTNVELLESEAYEEAEEKKFLQSIKVMSEQMRQLVGKLLLLARSDNRQEEGESGKLQSGGDKKERGGKSQPGGDKRSKKKKKLSAQIRRIVCPQGWQKYSKKRISVIFWKMRCCPLRVSS